MAAGRFVASSCLIEVSALGGRFGEKSQPCGKWSGACEFENLASTLAGWRRANRRTVFRVIQF
jgi:hypothetical protein